MSPRALDTFLSGVCPDAGPVVAKIETAVRAVAPLDSIIRWRQLLYGLKGDFHQKIIA